MARVKLRLPEQFLFATELRLRIGDMNYGGHLGNDAVLSLLHEARVRFLQRYGYSETDVDGAGIIMSDALVVYKSQAYQGETVRVEVAVADATRCGCDIVYRVTERATGREIARAKTGIAFFDYEHGKVVSTPSGFAERVVSGTAAATQDIS